MRRRLAPLVIAAALWSAPARANIPAAYFACEDHREHEGCQLPGNRFGGCLLDTLCDDDDPYTPYNECLICRDPCGGTAPGLGCVLELTGEQGVCELGDGCEDNPATSFNECNICAPGHARTVKAEEGGCALVDAGAAAPWALVLIALAAQICRRRGQERQSGQ